MAAPSDKIQFRRIGPDDARDWADMVTLYRDSFPEDQQEPVEMLAERAGAGRYVVQIASVDGANVAFSILDYPPNEQYALFCFVAVRGDLRSMGIGAAVCRAAMKDFQARDGAPWLFIEAEDRQAGYYRRLGFLPIPVDYRVPAFDSDEEVVQMNLLAYPKSEIRTLKTDYLRFVIRDVFIDGYYIGENDPRLKDQLERIPTRPFLELGCGDTRHAHL